MSKTDVDAAPSVPAVQLGDVQASIFDPTEFSYEAHLFIALGDVPSARKFVGSVADQVTKADQKPAVRLSVGFSFAGLGALGIDPTVLATFPAEFQQGMAARATILGDNGRNAPETWEVPFGNPELHMWLMVQANDPNTMGIRAGELRSLARQNGATLLEVENGAALGPAYAPAKEHFGFNDNLGQPGVEGVGQPIYPGQGTLAADGTWKPLPAGCFLLGYPNGYGQVEDRPALSELRTNGTYMVFRKLEQHVAAFRSYVRETAKLLALDEELCAAKFVGRWQSGTPLELSPDHDDPSIAADPSKVNAFTYEADGINAPHFSHLRRANPRNSLGERSVVDMTNHRIIRRSIPYGPFLADGAPDDGVPRGLYFRAFNASILDQFEMIQSTWINAANEMHGLSSDRDPWVGTVEPVGPADRQLGASFTIPLAGGGCPTRYNLPYFVTVKGGEYFFVPGIAALRWLVNPTTPGAPS